jgi:tight adherence protein C
VAAQSCQLQVLIVLKLRKETTMLPTSVLVAIAALSLSMVLCVWSLFGRGDPRKQRAFANLQQGMNGSADSPSNRRPGAADATNPSLRLFARRLSPKGTIRRLDRLLSRAGRPQAWPLDRLLAAKLIVPSALAAAGLCYVSTSPGSMMTLLAAAITVVGYFLPELLLYSRGQERSQTITLELADTMDQMTIAVEAGLGFDSAMARAGKNGTGPLAEELVRTLQDMQVGQSRRQAYESLASRTGVADLRRFVRAIIQADIYGIAVADVLRTQAAEMRMKRRQRAEEKAMQIPIKVIFPLMLCILPVLFIVLLGPAAMDIVKAFR